MKKLLRRALGAGLGLVFLAGLAAAEPNGAAVALVIDGVAAAA
jgi:hypothetical protein